MVEQRKRVEALADKLEVEERERRERETCAHAARRNEQAKEQQKAAEAARRENDHRLAMAEVQRRLENENAA